MNNDCTLLLAYEQQLQIKDVCCKDYDKENVRLQDALNKTLPQNSIDEP